ncbi:DNA-binding CsgD family transcriptional regulator [Streptomyces sp. SAI-208]|uniref:helix-turn-helix transcriptional regulator n=1 Tax=Streptomyces sp. SAI-208 TaxID=2940550 RepID=UPI002476029B|nr:LuxR C-terminal-related transcriptional regulator [Streptomyces sp. SAI-208]MDH6605841.1 DNA-binding CsgD family transcriptional regulator [Streptomyces sp. SAI-208]
MTTFERDAKTLELPWPFTGREDELELVRGAVAGGRQGIVVTGPAGRGKTRLVTEAVRGTDCARVAGTPDTHGLPFAAFAHLLPETVSLHRAVHLLSSVRLLLVDDAHLLDDASAALVHQLAVHGRTRLLVVATEGARTPGAISRLWTAELLPRLALEPLPREETARLLAAGAGGPEALTVNRLYRLCQGDLRLLRELVDAVRERGLLRRVPDSAEWEWRGPVPLTATVRERVAHLLDRTGPGERETLDRLAFGEPLPADADTLDLAALEALEADGLVHVDEHGTVRLAHPLHGPALRAAAGRLRARRLARTPSDRTAALETETAGLARAIAESDVRAVPAPVGEWLVDEGTGIPAPHAAVRARFARLRGQLREAAAWAREGLRSTPDDRPCRCELTLATAQSGTPVPGATQAEGPGSVVTQAGDPEPAGVQWSASVPRDAQAEGPGSVVTRAGDPEPVGAQSGTPVPGDTQAEGPGSVVTRAGDPEPAGGRAGDSEPVGAWAGADGGRAAVSPGGPGERGSAVLRGNAGDHRPSDPAAPSAGPAGRPAPPAADSDAPRVTAPTVPSAGAATWRAAARGDLEAALGAAEEDPYEAVRLGAPDRAVGRLTGVFAAHAEALARSDGPGLDRAAQALEERGFLLFAAEAYAQAAGAHRDPSAARTARTRAVALARRCQGARTPALSGLVLGELTARQRQIVTLAAAGLSNRQIAEKLTLSIRTVGNHLYSAYARLGASDRDALPCLVELPEAQPA